MAQSTNDMIPTAIRLACSVAARARSDRRVREPARCAARRRAREFDDVVKAGRTHLQDAMPIRLGQEFNAYAGSIDARAAAR